MSRERPEATRASSRRLSRWSRKNPVFWPRRTSAARVTSPSRNSISSGGFGAGHRAGGAVGQALGAARAHVAALVEAAGGDHLEKGGHHPLAHGLHPGRVDLEDDPAGVVVDHQPRKAVALAVHEADRLDAGQQRVVAAQLHGALDAAPEEVGVDPPVGAAGEDADGDLGPGG